VGAEGGLVGSRRAGVPVGQVSGRAGAPVKWVNPIDFRKSSTLSLLNGNVVIEVVNEARKAVSEWRLSVLGWKGEIQGGEGIFRGAAIEKLLRVREPV
jgi:hypothetical protein